jgi:ABC-type lipoprotein release transport system permease subunit
VKIFNRQRNILEYTLLSLYRRKGRNFALVAVYSLIIALLTSVSFLTSSIKNEALEILKESPEIIVQRLSAGRHDLIPSSYLEALQDIRGVKNVVGRLWGYYYDPTVGANYTVLSQDRTKVGEWDRLQPGEIIIGSAISRTRDVQPGDIFPFRTYSGKILTLFIQGIMPAASELVAADIILMNQEDFHHLFDVPEKHYTDIALEVRNSRELSAIARKISERFPNTRPIIKDEILRSYDAVFNWRSGILLVVLSGAILAFMIFAWDRASGLSAEEKREIGILKAIGWEISDVLSLKFWEGAVVSFTSFLLGILLGYIHITFFSAALFESVLKGWSILYPQFKILPYIDMFQVVVLFFLTVVPYTVVTIIPSWRAATTDPDAVMRE